MLVAMALCAASLPARAQTVLEVDATFHHSKASIPYRGALTGLVTVAVERPPNGQVAFRLGLGDQTCRLALLWALGPNAAPDFPKVPTAPIEACLTRIDIDESAFNLWRYHGRASVDPTLVVPLIDDPQKPGRMVSREALRGRLFVRDCHGDGQARYRKYADITINAGALELNVRPNQSGALDVNLIATGGALDQIDKQTWKDVVRKCGNAHIGLPDTPAAGLSPFLIGGSAGLAPRGDPIHQALGDLRRHIEDLHADEVLKWGDATGLVLLIDAADELRQQSRSENALQTVDRLANDIQLLNRSGVLPPEDAKILLSGAQGVRAEINESLFGVVGVLRKCAIKECLPITLHVDNATTAPASEQDGSAARPFGSISAALDAAAARGACGVSVVAAPGTYSGNLVITRNTSIIGEMGRRGPLVVIRGSLESNGAHDLSIDGVSFLESPGAAIRVSNPCAYTVLRAVNIESAMHFGIDIDGGAFAANNVRVASTRGTIAVISSGVGIRLQGGAQAAMNHFDLFDNDGQGMTVIGEGTRAYARTFAVTHNRILGGLFNLLAAVSALDGGLLLMEESVIEDNEYFGLFAAARSRIHFRAGRVTGTRRVDLPGFRGREGGLNVASHTNSIVELNTFTVSDGDTAGLQYLGATGIATDGFVLGNPVGASIQGTIFPAVCITRDVLYDDNDRDFDGDRLTVPDATPPPLSLAPVRTSASSPRGSKDGYRRSPLKPSALSEPSEPSCPVVPVPFNCDWCTDG